MDVFHINIAFCDDNTKERMVTKQLCMDYFSTLNLAVDFFEFSSGISLLNSEARIDLLFLDIELGDINGIDVMHKLEGKKNVWKIIFTTGYDDYMPDAFGMKTLGFLTKPINKNHLKRYLSSVQNELFLLSRPPISVPNHADIALSDILYIKSSGSYYDIFLSSAGEKISCSGSVTSFIASANVPFFVRTRKGTYVNLLHVTKSNDKKLILSNNTLIPLSSHYSEEFKKEFNRFTLLGRR